MQYFKHILNIIMGAALNDLLFQRQRFKKYTHRYIIIIVGMPTGHKRGRIRYRLAQYNIVCKRLTVILFFPF